MAGIACKYHPQTPARWNCRHCAINFCPSCVPAPPPGREPSCPVCSKALSSLGTGNAVAPFWLQLGRLFRYPASPGPLLLLLVLTLLGASVQGIPLFGGLLGLVLWAVSMKYAYVVLEDVAHGHLRARPLTGEAIAGELELPFKQVLLIAAIVFANLTVLRWLGEVAFAVALIFSTLAFPANMMVLALEHSVFKAFNPALAFSVMKRIGPAYLLLWVVLWLMGGAVGVAMHFAFEWLPVGIARPAADFLGMYFTLVMFATMGYVLYQYHEELGYEVEEPQAQAGAPAVQVSPELRQAEILIQEGKTEEAVKWLAQIVRGAPADDAARQLHLRLLRAGDDKAGHCRACQDYISYLFHQERHAQALKVLGACREFDPALKPAGARERLELARLLKAEGRGRAAMALLSNLHQDHPNFAGIPEAYLLVAQLMCEQFGEDAKALQVLRFVAKHFPDHPLQDEVRKYLALVEGMAAG